MIADTTFLIDLYEEQAKRLPGPASEFLNRNHENGGETFLSPSFNQGQEGRNAPSPLNFDFTDENANDLRKLEGNLQCGGMLSSLPEKTPTRLKPGLRRGLPISFSP